ncbi:hypothetical protein BDV06DRAFT_207087 [Aspergillus oleicola]
MYLVGNSETYANVPMWSDVIGMLRLTDSIGTSFGLCCPRHPDIEIPVSTPEEFEIRSPQGGCNNQCDERLERCGHACRGKCHSATLHKAFHCPVPCERLFQPCGHSCPGICGESCGKCKVIVTNVALPCGHIKDQLFCHETQNLGGIKCRAIVNKVV